ncbi:translation elongation factor EF-1 alpha [Penicillium nucicola]|uniref:translation elongation factor EF-1 alpha n=1 Tax=Penicillium nucicola TaxID=1850975 RepID=UPI002544DADB|nr:translation elongation factor EF-1 alpha [Penicillium nucicola]KAJ5775654.1 translation elongation factor EF-1 alpha [Penicillium nucicola]
MKDKVRLNFVVFGDESSGKSTLAGMVVNLLLGAITRQHLESAEQNAINNGDQSLKFSRVIDDRADSEEDVNIDSFAVLLRRCQFSPFFLWIDAPDPAAWFAYADTAILVISATYDLGNGIQIHSPIFQQLISASALGLREIIVAVNKMDAIGWNEDRWNEFLKEFRRVIKKAGFDDRATVVVPVSGYNGDNILEDSATMPWYRGWAVTRHDGSTTERGKTLSDAIEISNLSERRPNDPLRLLIDDVYETDDSDTIANCYVVAGTVDSGIELRNPAGDSAEVESLSLVTTGNNDAGYPGDFIACTLTNMSGCFTKGQVVGNAAEDEFSYATSFTARVVITGKDYQIYPGYRYTLCGLFNTACEFSTLLCTVNPRNGNTIVDSPEFIKTGNTAIVDVVPDNPIFVENIQSGSRFARFVIEDEGEIIGMGIIKSVEY